MRKPPQCRSAEVEHVFSALHPAHRCVLFGAYETQGSQRHCVTRSRPALAPHEWVQLSKVGQDAMP